MGCKRVTIFFILTHLRHDWDTGTVAPKVHKRCTRGAREVHERCTRGAREGHERGTRGAGEVHLWALKGTRYFSFWHGWDTVGTRLGHGDIGAIGAQEVHERGTRGAREVHERGTRGAREGHERGTRGAREVHRLTSLRPCGSPVCPLDRCVILYDVFQTFCARLVVLSTDPGPWYGRKITREGGF